jgi:hypothetical protein
MTTLLDHTGMPLKKDADDPWRVGYLEHWTPVGRGRSNFLGEGWVDFHDIDDTYAPCGIMDDAVVCNRPLDNVNVDMSPSPPYHGIGGAYRHAFVGDKQVTCRIPGGVAPNTLREIGPAISVVPGSAPNALGLWTSHLFGGGLFFICYQANPCTDFASETTQPEIAIGSYDLTDPALDEDYLFTLRMTGNELRAYDWLEREIALTLVQHGGPNIPIPYYEVLPEFVDSPYVGFVVDCHLCPTVAEMQGPVMTDWWCSSID